MTKKRLVDCVLTNTDEDLQSFGSDETQPPSICMQTGYPQYAHACIAHALHHHQQALITNDKKLIDFHKILLEIIMWKLKTGEGNDPWLFSANYFVGRQIWEFDHNLGTPEEREKVEKAREEYHNNRFKFKASNDLLMQLQQLQAKRSHRSTSDNLPIEMYMATKINLQQPFCLYQHAIRLVLQALTKDIRIDETNPPLKLQDNEDITYEVITNALKRATRFVAAMQVGDGHWPAECSGPLFLIPPLIIVLHISGTLNVVITPERREEILRYTYNQQNQDGGWGLNVGGDSIMFATVLNYVALRLLGEELEGSDKERCLVKARKWILDRGGATYISTWGKFYLSVLGVYEWAGTNPIPPEVFLLPSNFPINPGKLWCYCRVTSMAMSYVYGKRFVGPISSLILILRQELYNQSYQEIDWDKARHLCAKEDVCYQQPLVQSMLWDFLHMFVEPLFKHWPFSKLRTMALEKTIKHIHYEDESSRYIVMSSAEKLNHNHYDAAEVFQID
ncbi:hypothetical protein Syun_028394 [Stephania yunnanensis]|uniref:Squalene cyclase N-terminal domain-containing protein n=1 Tax=Stephania yunnanensis TaxID=152371 RepID=A0AAP0EMW9_9MAGN